MTKGSRTMEAVAVKHRVGEGKKVISPDLSNQRYAKKEPADMPVIVVESVEDVEKLTAMMEIIHREFSQE